MIYDFAEILGRGIIAARSGGSAQAIKYLDLAAGLEPANPRVWLWLTAAAETIAQKRHYLEQALKANPNSIVAQAFLDRLSHKCAVSNQPASDFVIFTCPSSLPRRVWFCLPLLRLFDTRPVMC
jgi:hypothetical protein